MKIGIIDSGIDSYFISTKRIVIKQYSDFYIGNESDNYRVVSKRYNANDLARWYLYPHTDNFMTDSNGHGTKILEIITNVYSNGEYIIAKVLNENIRTNSASLLKAFEWIINEKPRIIHMSLGLFSENGKNELYDLTLKALSNNIVVCCAAHYEKSFPAMFDTVMTIGHSDFLKKHNNLAQDIRKKINVIINKKVTEKSDLFKRSGFACAYFTGYLANKLDKDRNLKKKRKNNIENKNNDVKKIPFKMSNNPNLITRNDFKFEKTPIGIIVTCPNEKKANLKPGLKKGIFVAKFQSDACSACGKNCPAFNNKESARFGLKFNQDFLVYKNVL